MTLDIEAINERESAATSGPWTPTAYVLRVPGQADTHWAGIECGNPWGEVARIPDVPEEADAHADARFIAHARTDIPALVAEVRRLNALLGGQATDD